MELSLKKTEKESDSLENIYQKIKVQAYSLLHELIQADVTSKLIYKLLILIESAQVFWYMIHPRFDFLWDTDIANAIRQPFKYLQIDYFLNQNNKVVFLSILYVVIGIETLMAILAFIIIRHINGPVKKRSTLMTYTIKTVSLFAVLFNTILTLPFFNIFIAALYCQEEDPYHGDMDCYTGTYLIHFAFAIIGTIIFLAFLVLFLPFYIDLNPWSTLPSASPMSIIPFGKLLMKIFIPGYFTIDYNGTLNVQFAAIAGIYWVIVLYFRFQTLPYYDRSVNRFIMICESILVWSGGVLNIHAFLDSGAVDNIGLLYLLIAAPFITATVVSFIERQYEKPTEEDPRTFKKAEDMEMYINNLIHLIENKHDPIKKIHLEGVLRLHIMNSEKPDTQSTSIKLIQSNPKEETPEKDLLWYQWLRDILAEGLEKFEEDATLHLLNAYLHQEKLSNRFKSLYELLIADENKPQIQQEFAIFCYKNVIEEEIIELDANSSESKGIDVNILVHFQNKFVEFQSELEKAVSYHLDFWRELMEDSPDIQKLQGLSSKITDSVEEVAESFNKISEINNNHTKLLRIYGNFLQDIVNDDTEGKRLLEKAEYIERTSSANKHFIDDDRLKYGENSNTCIVTCNGNYKNLGTITNINNEITRILEFSKGDLMGQNINRIMPKIIADSHDAFMRRYFETSEPFVMGTERLVFPTNKSGYLVACSLMIKVLPTLDEGIRVVGFLKDIENEPRTDKSQGLENHDDNVHYIMYGGENNVLFGISYSCFSSFGIPSSLMQGNTSNTELTIDAIIPGILNFSLEDMKNPSGFTTTLDSTVLYQNYYLGDNGSESEDEDGKSEIVASARHKKTTIRAVLIQDEIYKDIPKLRILKFVETGEGDDNYANLQKILPGIKDPGIVEESKIIGNDNIGPSEEKESISQDEGLITDKTKQLKDAKAMISEKKEPKSIKFLKRVGFAVVLGWLATSCVNLAMSFLMRNEVSEGAYATTVAYQRYDAMASINYQMRKLQLLSRQINITATSQLNAQQAVLQAGLVNLTLAMQTLQSEVIKASVKMERRASNSYPDQTVLVETRLSTTIYYENSSLTDALFTYLSQASSVRTATLSSFSLNSDVDTTQKNFYYVRRNGLGPLRNGSAIDAETFYDFYYSQIGNYEHTFLILTLVAIFVILMGDAFSMPVVFSLHRTNKKVLSMFGYISTDEINDLSLKCERFIIDHLEDRAEKKDYSLDTEEGKDKDDSPTAKDDESSIQQDENVDSSNDDHEGESRKIRLRKRKSNASPKSDKSPRKSLRLLDKEEPKLEQNEEEADALVDQAKAEERQFTRSQKLLNSRKSENKSDIFKFLVFTTVFVGGSIGYFFFQKDLVSDSQLAFEHLKLISQGIPQIRYINVYTLEELAENNITSVYTYILGSGVTTFNSRQYFLSAVQDNERDISNSLKRNFPSYFDSYKTLFTTLSFEDMCSGYYTAASDQTACAAIQDGLLQQGLKVGVRTIVSTSIDLMNEYYVSDQSATTQNNTIYSDEFTSSEAILQNITSPLMTLLSTYQDNFDSFVNHSLDWAKVRFSLAVAVMFFGYFLIWLPYMKKLRDDIWRTKGMLNMIPMEIISQNENLSDLLISGQLIKAVQ